MRPAPRPTTSMSTSAPAAPPPAAAAMQTSPWHSPVPYLFGGLAAMLGLIALALLILACSYWKLNHYLDAAEASSAAAPGATNGDGSKSPAATATASPGAFADLVAVVMAGEKTPTFLAAPVVRRVIDDTAAVAVGDGSAETEEEKSGAVADAERDRQLDHV
ncbi:hypothetical protein ACP70R_003197 [Stipagrostis hirtigluma subsp. patula]